MASPGNTIYTAFNSLVSTTYRNYGDKLFADNVSNHNALFRYIERNGNKRVESGGLSIVQLLDFAENSTFQRYSGYDTLAINASEVLTSAEFQWRTYHVAVTASGSEIRSNSGPFRIANLVKNRLTNAIRTMANHVSADMYGDGTLPNQIGGLQAYIPDTGLGTVGTINAALWPFWRNKVQSAAAPLQGGAAVTYSSTTIEPMMLPLYIATTRGNDMVDLIMMSDDLYNFYELSQVSLKRYVRSDMAEGGFENLAYKNATVMFDSSGGLPPTHAYFINTKYMHYVVHKDANYELIDEMRPYNQDAVVMPLLVQHQMTVSNRFLQGVMTL